jgi:hypothetical protein
MRSSIVFKEGETQDLTLGSNTQNVKLEKNVPQGLIRSISLHTFTTAFALGGGSAVTDGEKKILRSVSVKSDKHGVLYQNVSGLSLYRLMTLIFSKAPAVTAVGASGYAARFPIPLGYMGHLRHPAKRINDMSLWAFTTKPIIELVYGVLTDVVTGGTPSGSVRIRPVFQYEPNPNPLPEDPKASDPVAGSGDRPKYQIEVIGTKFASLSTSGRNEQNLPIGQNRIPLYIMLHEKNSSTGAEVSDIFTARTSKLDLRHGSDYLFEQVSVTDLDEMMADFLNLSSLPAGVHLIPLTPDGKIADSILLDAFSEFKIAFDNCATASTRDLEVYLVNAVPVRGGAEPENQKA